MEMTESNNVVATWSNYEQLREQTKYETRLESAELIQRKINIVREAKISEHLLFGLELAKSIVLGFDKDVNDGQDTLPF